MSTIAEIRAGLVKQLETIGTLSVYGTESGSITPPAAVIVTPSITYHGTFKSSNALNTYAFRVIVLVAQSLVDEAAHTLDTYADPTAPTSIRAAIEADPTLGGAAEGLVVESFRPLNSEDVASLQYWGGEFSVTVYAR